MIPFDPLFRNPHLQTILGAFWPRPFDPTTFPIETHYFDSDTGTRVLVHSQSPRTPPRGALLLIHGLEGSSNGGYMRSAAHAALTAGYAVHRLNTRGCGGTEALTNTLYHAGLTTDVRFVLEHLRHSHPHLPLFAAGFSLGANMILKLAGELGPGGPQLLNGVIAISAPIDLHACALALCEPRCRLYQQRFVRFMSARLRRRHQLHPELFALDKLNGIRSVYEFDDRITAPFFGFGTAQNYYATQSCGLFLHAIQVPTLILHAKDDPMIPFHVYDRDVFRTNPHLNLVTPDHGGHVGFLARNGPRFFADTLICHWMHHIGNNRPTSLVF